ncbi:phage tail tip fiber protein [Bradyrhizobium japonicum]|uniref:phage tail tip fiber protein n=1 Tax=Bradyrhizobium japonicum TaxID=375 RepID=UPI00271461E1|nr:DUF1983 domain-containing protein [Bradyrhizobium japonicum]WLB16177.1 DUF1983 domain-containing protein [Bradyrhizobium japonicum]
MTLAALRVRVQAVTPGKLRGPYATADVSAPTITIANNTVALESLIEGIKYQVTTLQSQNADKLSEIENRVTNLIRSFGSKSWLQQKELRSQFTARTDDAFAEIEDVRQVAVDTETAFANFSTTVTATWGSTTAFVQNSATAIATLNGYAAASYAVTLNVNGYATGFSLVNGGSGISSFTVVADKFQVQLPGYNGSAPLPVFTIGTLNGVAAIGLSGNVYLDGTFNVKAIAAGSIDVVYLKANSIDSASGVIKALGVGSLSIADNAVTVPVAQTTGAAVFGAGFGNWVSFFSFNMSIDTTGLSGKPIVIYVSVNSMWASGSPATETGQFRFLLNGSQVNYYQVTLPTGASAPIPLSGAISITGTGGIVSVPIAAQFGSTSSCAMLAGATLFAVAAKR